MDVVCAFIILGPVGTPGVISTSFISLISISSVDTGVSASVLDGWITVAMFFSVVFAICLVRILYKINNVTTTKTKNPMTIAMMVMPKSLDVDGTDACCESIVRF